jgi:hypothetical protein
MRLKESFLGLKILLIDFLFIVGVFRNKAQQLGKGLTDWEDLEST